MALWYVRSGAGGTASGADWANAKLTLAAAFTAGAAGDTFYVSEDHAETQASAMTLTSPGTSASPCRILCVNHSGSVPPVAADLRTTATISTTGANSITRGGVAYIEGITFSAGSGAVVANIGLAAASAHYLKNCNLILAATGLCSINHANINIRERWENVTLTFGATGHVMQISGGQLDWFNTPSAIAGAIQPTVLFGNGNYGNVTMTGVDLSAMGSGKTIIQNTIARFDVDLIDCQLNASLAGKIAALTIAYGGRVRAINCDSGATNYKRERTDYYGSETTETTTIRTGGASNGTTGVSKKVVTTANASFAFPFRAGRIEMWNDTSGSSKTLTVECTLPGAVSLPNNDDIWIDVQYLGSSSNPQASKISSAKATVLTTGSALSSSAEVWAGTTTPFKMAVTFTPQMKGPLLIDVMVGKASMTVYVDENPTLV